jgi:DNA gyrase/topoisomerase IV subunit A
MGELMTIVDAAADAQEVRRQVELACDVDDVRATAILDLQVLRVASPERMRILDDWEKLRVRVSNRQLGRRTATI